MNLQERCNNELIREILKNFEDINTSNYYLDGIVTSENIENSQKMSLIEQIIGTNNNAINIQKEMVSELLNRIDLILQSRKEKKIKSPSKQKMKELINSFFSQPLPIALTPYPPLCGAIRSDIDELIKPDSFVCVKNNEGDYILAVVIDFDAESSSYLVCDADPEMVDIITFYVKFNDVIPLSTSSPSKRNKQTTYSLRSKVLALWYDEVGGWTSVFYKATVLKTPQAQDCNYYLKFDGNPPLNSYVQEKFIVYSPED